MKKSCAVVVAAGLLSGCVLPIPITIASLMADGFTMAASDKTVFEHSLSSVTGRDCGFIESFEYGQICRDETGSILVADTSDAGEWTQAQSPMTTAELKGYTEQLILWDAPVSSDTILVAETDAGETAQAAAPLLLASNTELPATISEQSPSKMRKAPASDDLFYVIGSFYTAERAIIHAKRFNAVDSQVFQLRLGERTVYRVAVGPFTKGERKSVRRDIRNAGIKDPWAIRPEGVGQTVIARPNAPTQVALDQAS